MSYLRRLRDWVWALVLGLLEYRVTSFILGAVIAFVITSFSAHAAIQHGNLNGPIPRLMGWTGTTACSLWVVHKD